MDTTIKPALIQHDEIPQLAALLKKDGLPFEDSAAVGSDFWGIWREKVLLGGIGLSRIASYALLRSLVVSPEQRGEGLGGQLVDWVLSRAAEEQLNAVYLITDGAGGFFQKHHFEDIPRQSAPEGIRNHPQFTDLCPDNARVMVFKITPSQKEK